MLVYVSLEKLCRGHVVFAVLMTIQVLVVDGSVFWIDKENFSDREFLMRVEIGLAPRTGHVDSPFFPSAGDGWLTVQAKPAALFGLGLKKISGAGARLACVLVGKGVRAQALSIV